MNGLAVTDNDVLTISGTGLAATPRGAITNSSRTAASYGGAIVLGGDATVGAAAAGTLTLSGGVTGAFNLTINNVAAGGTTFSTVAVNNGGTITNNGAGAGTPPSPPLARMLRRSIRPGPARSPSPPRSLRPSSDSSTAPARAW